MRIGSMEVLVFCLVAFAISGARLRAAVAGNAMLATAGTVFCGVFVQALPFLGLGVVVSGLIAVFVPPERSVRWLPRRGETAVLAAGLAGASAGQYRWRDVCSEMGAVGAAALTFMPAAPAINPVVVVATTVAIPGQPKIVIAMTPRDR